MKNFYNKYDKFAEDYKRKRSKPWKFFVNFLLDFHSNIFTINHGKFDINCDLGCGTGRNFEPIVKNSGVYIGLDLSFEMLKLFRKETLNNFPEKKSLKLNLISADIENIPLRENSVNKVISMAVIHHILNKNKRNKTYIEINRIMRKDEFIILSLWSSFNGKNFAKLKRFNYFLTLNKNRKIPKKVGDKSNTKSVLKLKRNDLFLPWKTQIKGKEVLGKRIYHLFNFNKLQEIKRYFEIIAINIYGNENSGINYFLLCKNSVLSGIE